MDLEQLAQLVTTLAEKVDSLGTQNEALKAELLGEVDRRNKGVASSVAKQLKQLQEPASKPETDSTDEPAKAGGVDSGSRIQMKQMQDQLATLQSQLETEKNAALMGNRRAALTGTIASKKVIAPGILFDALDKRFGDALKQEGGSWFVESGESVETLDAVINKFLATDEGKAFLPPSGVTGAGSSESKKPQSITDGMTAGAALMAI